MSKENYDNSYIQKGKQNKAWKLQICTFTIHSKQNSGKSSSETSNPIPE